MIAQKTPRTPDRMLIIKKPGVSSAKECPNFSARTAMCLYFALIKIINTKSESGKAWRNIVSMVSNYQSD